RGLNRAERSLRAQHALERLTLHEVHAQADAPLVRLDVEDADDVDVPNPGERATFTHQALGHTRVGDVRVKNLDRDLALEFGIPRAVDVAEASFANLLHQLVPPPRGHGRPGRHIGRRR